MNKSEQINELALALSKAQGELEAVKFDTLNKYYGSRYASLSAVIESIKPILPRYGLSIAQHPFGEVNQNGIFIVGIETMLLHSSGQWISESVSVPIADTNMLAVYTTRDNDKGDKYFTGPNILQESGKVITYLRRYGIVSILRLSAEEDTDGNPDEQIQETKSGSAEKKPPAIYDPLAVKAFIQKKAKLLSPASEKQIQLVQRKFQELIEDEDERHQVILFLTGAEHVKNADPTVINSILKWMRLDENYQLSAEAEGELAGIRAYLAAEEE